MTRRLRHAFDATAAIVSTAVLLMALAMLVGCASPAAKVLKSVNAYEYHVARHAEKCPAAPTCKAEATTLQKWSKALDEASAALKRGGALPLQLGALKSVEKEMPK